MIIIGVFVKMTHKTIFAFQTWIDKRKARKTPVETNVTSLIIFFQNTSVNTLKIDTFCVINTS